MFLCLFFLKSNKISVIVGVLVCVFELYIVVIECSGDVVLFNFVFLIFYD